MCPKHPRFAEEEDTFLRSNCSTMSRRDMAAHLDRSVRAVESRGRKLGLRKFRIRAFTAKEDRVIRSAKGRTSVEIARLLERSPAVVRMRALRLGLGKWKSIKPNASEYRGYKVREIHLPNGKHIRIPEHRAIMGDHLGRRLTDSERVHHIDFDKRNNRIRNLYLCESDAEHRRIHSSATRLLTRVFYGGRLMFDRKQGLYRLCETSKQ